jgi:biotin-[acetyl-CoA-carboxylase] ligase BirA-like protein
MNSAGFDLFKLTMAWAAKSRVGALSFETTDSTNLRAKSDPDFHDLYVARTQTAGRGRGQNTWVSTDGALLSSWRFTCASTPQPILSPLAGLALFDSIAKCWPGAPLSLKAPNDIYLGLHKLAGLLIETSTTGEKHECVVGLGLNVFSSPSEAVRNATSLSEHIGHLSEEDWRAFLTQWWQGIHAAVRESLAPEMTVDSRGRLLIALNRFPLLSEPILSVDGLGQLKSASRVWYWHEL